MNRKHLVRWALIALVIGVLGALLCQWLAPDQLIGFLIVSLFWNLLFAGVLLWIDRSIRTLSDQLMRVYSSRMSIDIHEQQEGALSILKNDIYKLVRTFYEQRERSARDRLFLADTLNDISHQLKTPLTSMQMMGELLALPLCYLIYQILGMKFTFAFYVPLMPILIAIAALFLLTLFMLLYHLSLSRKGNIIETIRQESI